MAELHLEYSASSEMNSSFINTLCLGNFRQSPGSEMGAEALLQLSSKSLVLAGAVGVPRETKATGTALAFSAPPSPAA